MRKGLQEEEEVFIKNAKRARQNQRRRGCEKPAAHSGTIATQGGRVM
jgi:hypothetical protein